MKNKPSYEPTQREQDRVRSNDAVDQQDPLDNETGCQQSRNKGSFGMRIFLL
jgi:hypothetical protein